MKASPVECVWAVQAELGEGPVWSAAEQVVFFVDIKGGQVHRFDAKTGEGRSWNAPSSPGFVAPVAGGGWLAGLKTGLSRFDPASGVFTPMIAVEPDRPDNRLNDACVDADGCVWTGLFGGWGLNRFSPDGELMQVIAFPCANVTKPTFGGDDLRTVYATTAWKGLSDGEREAQPLAGGLFRFRSDTPGLPQVEVRLDPR